jgi:SWI/SNF-related matrix-associated actin-dependent regulator of chromatin subfamily D
VDYNPAQYKLSDALASFVGARQETRENVMTLIWKYVTNYKLQDTEEPRFINNDETLYALFKEERTDIGTILKRLSDTHLQEPEPIEIKHRIRLSGEWVETEHIYNIAVDVEDPFQLELSSYIGEDNNSLFSRNSFIYNIRTPSDLEKGEGQEDPIAEKIREQNTNFA